MSKIIKTKIFILMILIIMLIPTVAFANDFNDFSAENEVNTEVDKIINGETEQQGGVENDAVMDYFKGIKPVSEKNMEVAVKSTSWFTNAIGNLIGVAIIILGSTQFLISVLDLIYITVPFLRDALDGSVVSLGGGGIIQGGIGMQGGTGQPDMPHGRRKRQFVSDEAIKALGLSGSGSVDTARQMNGGNLGGGLGYNRGGYGAGSFGMGNMGGYGMQGMQGMGAQQQEQVAPNKKLAITIYLEMRLIGLILFFVCLTLFTSSLVADCGINIAQFVIDMYNKFASGM